MPPRDGSSPMSAASSVVLPAPFGPMTVTIVPSLDLERHVVHRLDLAVGDVQTFDLEQRAWPSSRTPPR